MTRKLMPPRLYLDPNRKEWVIRYMKWFKRTGVPEDKKEWAEKVLNKILESQHYHRAFRDLKRPIETRHVGRPEARANWIGSVYFISKIGCSEYPIKIGFSGPRFKRRLCDIQTGNPELLEIIASQDGLTFGMEQQLHRIIDVHRVLGEWFARAEVVMSAVTAARQKTLKEWIENQPSSQSVAA